MKPLIAAVILAIAASGAWATLTGNGGLTVELDASGQIVACRWPSPSHFSQIPLSMENQKTPEIPPGLGWAVRIDERLTFLARAPWRTEGPWYRKAGSPVAYTRAILESPRIDTQQTVFVLPDRDLLVVQLQCSSTPPPASFYWFAGFHPNTRVIPEIPLDSGALPFANGFAAFWHPETDTMYHFRPMAPSEADWNRAKRLVEQRAGAGQWNVFGEGVWIAYGSPNTISSAVCLPIEETGPAWEALGRGDRPSRTAVTGQAQSLLTLQPEAYERGYRATIYAAFGATRDAAEETLNYARQHRFEDLEEECEAYWRVRLSLDKQHKTSPAAQPELMDSISIFLGLDRKTGALAAISPNTPGRMLATAETAAWGALALDTLGHHEEAARLLHFWAGMIRPSSQRGMPAGSIPAAVYANGLPALPHLVLDASATAWILGAIWRHAALLDGSARKQFLESVWEPVQQSGAFLAGWTRDSQGAPFASYHAERGRDQSSTAYDFAVLMGMVSAVNIAESLDILPPTLWRDRIIELNSLLRFHARNEGSAWELEPAFLEWLRGIVPFEDSLWKLEILQGNLIVPLEEIRLLPESLPPPSPGDTRAAAIRVVAHHQDSSN